MLRNKQAKLATIVIVISLIIMGIYALLRPPAPKPLPQQPEQQQETPQQIPNALPFDSAKYKNEPSVVVWLADKRYTQTMMMEKYLEGVVAQEMDPKWPIEALSAQAIVARTLSLKAMEAGTIRKLHRADVSTAKEELQAYAPGKVNDNVREAVKRTRGKIVLYSGVLVNAIYSSCNGGIAATREESFPTEIKEPTPYFQPVKDDCMQNAPDQQQRWVAKVSGSEVAGAVGYKGNPSDIKILEKGPSGRILFIGAGNSKISGAEFRKKIGFDRLRSTLITEVSYDNGQFTFVGQGWGNGVGLCQWGAYTYAQAGWNAEQILKHFYPGVTINKIWE